MVKDVTNDGLTLETEEHEGVPVFVPKHHLTDNVVLADGLLKTYQVGDKVAEALCFLKDVMPIMTLKPVILKAAKEGDLPKTFEDLQVRVEWALIQIKHLFD